MEWWSKTPNYQCLNLNTNYGRTHIQLFHAVWSIKQNYSAQEPRGALSCLVWSTWSKGVPEEGATLTVDGVFINSWLQTIHSDESPWLRTYSLWVPLLLNLDKIFSKMLFNVIFLHLQNVFLGVFCVPLSAIKVQCGN